MQSGIPLEVYRELRSICLEMEIFKKGRVDNLLTINPKLQWYLSQIPQPESEKATLFDIIVYVETLLARLSVNRDDLIEFVQMLAIHCEGQFNLSQTAQKLNQIAHRLNQLDIPSRFPVVVRYDEWINDDHPTRDEMASGTYPRQQTINSPNQWKEFIQEAQEKGYINIMY